MQIQKRKVKMNYYNKINVTTASIIDGWCIDEYIGIVSSHVVAGTNVFSDIAASFSDVFGGRSESYNKQLSIINEEVIHKLMKEGVRKKGNWLIGLSIDHDEISGQDKSMFMVTATATVVRASNHIKKNELTLDKNIITYDEYKSNILKNDIISKSQIGDLSYEEQVWDYIYDHDIKELIIPIVEKLKIYYSDEKYKTVTAEDIRKYKNYFKYLNKELCSEVIYKIIEENIELAPFFVKIAKEENIINYQRIIEIIKSENTDLSKQGLPLLIPDKDYYCEDDINQLDQLISVIEKVFPKNIEYNEKKEMFSSKMVTEWKCSCGKLNNKNDKYCYSCRNDAYGFKENEINPEVIMKLLSKKKEILKTCFENKKA